MDPVLQLEVINKEVVSCRACPRLVSWREKVSEEKHAAYKDQEYWGLPVPGFGDPQAKILIVGLAPGAHGANRTGRVFTGDRSGDFLYAALYRAGLASQPESVGLEDGLKLENVFITSPVKCVPPANKPNQKERSSCRPFFERELSALSKIRVVVALGQIGYASTAFEFGLKPAPKFSHGLEVDIDENRKLFCSYHVSQQNTFTGRLTDSMFDAVIKRAKIAAGD